MSRFQDQHKRKAVTFSYDDGITQDIRLIELLNKYNLKGTFNLNSELLGTSTISTWDNTRIARYVVHANDVKYIYEGHEVAAHTLTHPNLTTLEDTEVLRQIRQDQANLSELVGYPVVGLAYPCGDVNHDERVVDIIKNKTSIRYCRTVATTGKFEPPPDLYRFSPTAYHRMDYDQLMRLGEAFVNLETDTPKILSIYGHSYEMDFSSDLWVKLEEFFRLISNRDDIFYGTNADVLL